MNMVHADIARDDVVDRYVRGQLTADEERSFEDHFFGCEECFDRLQEAERFHAGVRDAAAHGRLDRASAMVPRGGAWLRWGFAMASCVSAVLLVVTGWLYFRELPRLRLERDREAAQRRLEPQTATPPVAAGAAAEGGEANVALVMLQASRTAETPERVTLRADARRLVVWIEIGPSRFRSFRLEAFTPDGRRAAAVDGLERGPYGALAASIPAAELPAGDLRITLSGQDPPPAALLGDYRLTIEKR